MTKLLKRAIILVVMAVVLINTTGCNQNANVNKEAAPISAYEPKADKQYEISWTFYQTAPLKSDAVMKKFWEDKFNVKLDVWDIENNRAEEIINLRMSSGEIPDKFSAKSNLSLSNYVDQDVIAEIPMEVLEKYGPNILKRLNQDVPGALDYCKIDGKLYGIPTYTMNVARNPIVWRGDWLKNVGIEKIPETLDEFEEAFYKFTNEDPDGNGIKDTYGLSSTALMPVFLAYGYLPIVTGINTNDLWKIVDGKILCAAVQPEMKDALERINKWYNDGIIDPEFVTGENQGGYWALSHAFINGRIGTTSLGQTYHYQPKFFETDNYGVNREELNKLNPAAAEAIVIGNPPIGPNGERGALSNPPAKEEKIVFGKNLVNEPDKMGKILQMLDWIYESKTNHLITTMGIEGQMWENQERTALNGNSYTAAVAIGEYAEGSALNAHFAHTAMSIFEPSFSDEDLQTTPYKEWELSIGSDKYRVYNALQSALPSQSQYIVELNKLEQEAYLEIITGKKPISYFDDFVVQWRKLGGEILEKEAQEWYESTQR